MNNNNDIEKTSAKPLGAMVDFYLWIHSRTSIRARLFGVDPTKTPAYIKRNEGYWFNRDFLIDLYALIWPIIFWCVLWWLGKPSAICVSRHVLIIVGLISAYRLNELLGGVFYILIKRARVDYADGRKLAISLLAYFEPIVIFAVLHGVVSDILANGNVALAGKGYDIGNRLWRASTIFHFSVGCYTTVGWGDVSPLDPFAVFLSDLEGITGILMITLTLSRFVAAALDQGMSTVVSGSSKEH